jgi:hypothetical protein
MHLKILNKLSTSMAVIGITVPDVVRMVDGHTPKLITLTGIINDPQAPRIIPRDIALP